MGELYESLTSPTWWISVVVVGIGVNLLSAYLKPLLDRRMAGYSSARAERLTKIQTERSARIQKMKESDRALFLAARKEQGWWMWAILLYALATLIFTMGRASPLVLLSIVSNLLAIMLVLLGIHSTKRAIAAGNEIDDAVREG